jgi:hypothetical protein
MESRTWSWWKSGVRAGLVALGWIVIWAAAIGGCSDASSPATPDDGEIEIPEFVRVNYIDVDTIYQISKFRSGIGHDYSDDFESCRSMKHYFQPKADVDWSSLEVFSPVTGTVSRMFDEWAGTQVHIRSEEYPSFVFMIFHIDLSTELSVGDSVTAGQQLGTHIGAQTLSDIAVGTTVGTSFKLVSYFDVLADEAFQEFQARGMNSRDDAIISEEARDADPLTCTGEDFANSGNLENWVVLTDE